jgi:hypothetical protein
MDAVLPADTEALCTPMAGYHLRSDLVFSALRAVASANTELGV